MARATDDRSKQVVELTRDEAYEIIDKLSRRHFEMSADEFIDAWKSDQFYDVDTPEVMRVAMLLPLVTDDGW